MLYLTKDSGTAVGEIIAAISASHSVTGVELKLTQDTLIASLRVGGKRKTIYSSAVENPIRAKGRSWKKRSKKKGRTSKIIYDYDGESMGSKEWAKKLHVSDNCIRYRFNKFGNPYGLKGPTDSDKIIAGS